MCCPQQQFSFDDGNASRKKCLQRLRKVEAEVRSTDTVMRTMRGTRRVLRLPAIKKQDHSILPAIAAV
jgi:hypothetical protein